MKKLSTAAIPEFFAPGISEPRFLYKFVFYLYPVFLKFKPDYLSSKRSSRALPPGILSGHQLPRFSVTINAGTKSGSTINA